MTGDGLLLGRPPRPASTPPREGATAAALGLLVTLLVFVVVFVGTLLVMAGDAPPSPASQPPAAATAPPPRCEEDQPCWRCDLDGNRVCGPCAGRPATVGDAARRFATHATTPGGSGGDRAEPGGRDQSAQVGDVAARESTWRRRGARPVRPHPAWCDLRDRPDVTGSAVPTAVLLDATVPGDATAAGRAVAVRGRAPGRAARRGLHRVYLEPGGSVQADAARRARRGRRPPRAARRPT